MERNPDGAKLFEDAHEKAYMLLSADTGCQEQLAYETCGNGRIDLSYRS